jgi:hypothetical protein
MKLLFFTLTLLTLLLVAGCGAANSSASLTAPQPGAPCGAGVVCYETTDPAGQNLVPTGMCCWQGDVCGGSFPNVGCPPGQCCDVGFSKLALDGATSPARMRPQYRAQPPTS